MYTMIMTHKNNEGRLLVRGRARRKMLEEEAQMNDTHSGCVFAERCDAAA